MIKSESKLSAMRFIRNWVTLFPTYKSFFTWFYLTFKYCGYEMISTYVLWSESFIGLYLYIWTAYELHMKGIWTRHQILEQVKFVNCRRERKKRTYSYYSINTTSKGNTFSRLHNILIINNKFNNK